MDSKEARHFWKKHAHSFAIRRNKEKPLITLANGSQLIGRVNQNGIRTFGNIPYAEPPVGSLRFKPPQKKEPWAGVRDCSGGPGKAAMQSEVGLSDYLLSMVQRSGFSKPRTALLKTLVKWGPLTLPQDEDCLSLSICAPPDVGKPMPVMVWIHGGDFQDGSSSQFVTDSYALAEQGVAVVYINYRLNVFGYFAHPELSAETPDGDVPWGGDAGTRDQITALRWIQENIAAFGGDPNNVTIFGESAGGESVLHLMSAPSAEGLFHKAIAQSPSCLGKFVQRCRSLGPIKSAEQQGIDFATQAVGPEPGQLARLRQLSAKELQTAQQKLRLDQAKKSADGIAFYPCIGTESHAAIVAESPYSMFIKQKQHQVPLLIGINANEGSLLPVLVEKFIPASLQSFLHPVPPACLDRQDLPPSFGQVLQEHYPGLNSSPGSDEYSKTMEEIIGDYMFGRYAYLLATTHSGIAPSYLYYFKRVPNRAGQTVGATHAAEIGFVHGSELFFDPQDGPDRELARVMQRYWSSFASFGNPNGLGGPLWEPLATNSLLQREWMVLDRCRQPCMMQIHKEAEYELLLKPLRQQLHDLNNPQMLESAAKATKKAPTDDHIRSPMLMTAAYAALHSQDEQLGLDERDTLVISL